LYWQYDSFSFEFKHGAMFFEAIVETFLVLCIWFFVRGFLFFVFGSSFVVLRSLCIFVPLCGYSPKSLSALASFASLR
jgi:hypothetical protein